MCARREVSWCGPAFRNDPRIVRLVMRPPSTARSHSHLGVEKLHAGGTTRDSGSVVWRVVVCDSGRVDCEALPSGTVTFFFSDVEGSTRLVQELGEAAWA